MATKRDHAAMANRWLKAAKLSQADLSNSEIARRLGVHRHSVGAWGKHWELHGMPGLTSKGPPAPAEEELVAQKVLDRAVAAGHPTEVWALPRLARLIQDECRVKYHPGQVWHLLDCLGFSCQPPSRRAIEGNAPPSSSTGRSAR